MSQLRRKVEKEIAQKRMFKTRKAKLKLQEHGLGNHRLIKLGALIESRCSELDLEKFAQHLDSYKLHNKKLQK